MDAPPPAPLRRRRRRACALVGSLLVSPLLAALLGEVWVRWREPAYADQWTALTTHPRWARTLRPDTQGRLRQLGGGYDTRFATNPQGLREATPVGSKQPGRPRVLCVGDSNTFGLGVNDDQVWVRALSEAGVEPLNAGWASGYAPDTACVWLEEVGLRLEPDLVIQQLTSANDLEDLATRSVWATDARGRLIGVTHAWDQRVPPWVQALALPRYLALQVLPRLRGGTQGQPAGPPGVGQPTAAPEPTPEEREGLRRLRIALAQEQALLSGRGARLLVLLAPCFSGEPGHVLPREAARLQAKRAWIAGLVRELRLELLDPEGSPEWTAAGSPRFFPHDGHLTAAGNAALGRYVTRALRERLGR